MKFKVAWKVAGALVKPKGITKTSYWPSWVRNAFYGCQTGLYVFGDIIALNPL